MGEKVILKKLLEISKKYQIEPFGEVNLKETHIPFEGTPKKHPQDEKVILLLLNPFSKNHSFYEFPIESIGNVEDLGTITSEKGQSVTKIRVWVKKGMPAIKSEPFIVK